MYNNQSIWPWVTVVGNGHVPLACSDHTQCKWILTSVAVQSRITQNYASASLLLFLYPTDSFVFFSCARKPTAVTSETIPTSNWLINHIIRFNIAKKKIGQREMWRRRGAGRGRSIRWKSCDLIDRRPTNNQWHQSQREIATWCWRWQHSTY